MNNNNLIEVTEKLLYEKAKSSLNSYDSAQDSLDKAYLTIMFGNIAFYATKIKPVAAHVDYIYWDMICMIYMTLALGLILISFMLSKSSMKLLYDNTLIQISLLESEEATNEEIKQSKQKLLKIDCLNRLIEQLNWQIPCMVFFSSGLCFIKVGFQEIQLTLMQYFLCIWLLSVIIICIVVKGIQNGKIFAQ